MKKWVLPFMVALSLGAGAVVAQQGPATLGGNTANPTASTVTVSQNNITTTSTNGFIAQNTTAATVGVPIQYSPRILFSGAGWDIDDAVSRPVRFGWETRPVSANTVTGTMALVYLDPITSAITTPATFFSSGAMNLLGGLNLGATGFIGNLASSSGYLYFPSDGFFRFDNFASTKGVTLKVDSTPTVSACGAGSPAVVAGSTPLSGAVTIGTTAVATCTITFQGAAFPVAPHCSGAVETVTAANARAMGYSASTTVLTIVPSAAWADSSVVNWTCVSPRS